ncbi:hypothetical protein [Streptomyces sp. NPDC058583]|uniref:hypothetical protein n=1 Tax=unclassified Streptomyces TaxID=2593676 RepID=UPI003651F3A3
MRRGRATSVDGYVIAGGGSGGGGATNSYAINGGGGHGGGGLRQDASGCSSSQIQRGGDGAPGSRVQPGKGGTSVAGGTGNTNTHQVLNPDERDPAGNGRVKITWSGLTAW